MIVARPGDTRQRQSQCPGPAGFLFLETMIRS